MSLKQPNTPNTSPIYFTPGTGPSVLHKAVSGVTTIPPNGYSIGSGVPTINAPVGALYSRSDGATGTFLYRFNGKTWVPIL